MSEYRAEPMHPPQDAAEPPPRLLSLGDLLGEWEAYAEATHTALTTGTPLGPVTGIDRVNKELGGAFAPGLHFIHGNTGSGKTAFALQAAAEARCPALYVSCEMGALELLRRMTARVTGTYLGRLKTGEIPPKDSIALAKRACAAAPLLYIADATTNPASPEWVLKTARNVKDRHGSPHFLLVMDSLHSWVDGVWGTEEEYKALNAGLSHLRKISSLLECPILSIAERNRASMKTSGSNPNAGAGTRKIEYGAETMQDLNRKKDDDAAGPGDWVDVDLIFSKNRNGAAGRKVELQFCGALQQFRDAHEDVKMRAGRGF